MLTQVLAGNVLLLLLHFGCTTNQRSIPFGSPSSTGLVSSVFSVVLIPEESDGVGERSCTGITQRLRYRHS